MILCRNLCGIVNRLSQVTWRCWIVFFLPVSNKFGVSSLSLFCVFQTRLVITGIVNTPRLLTCYVWERCFRGTVNAVQCSVKMFAWVLLGRHQCG